MLCLEYWIFPFQILKFFEELIVFPIPLPGLISNSSFSEQSKLKSIGKINLEYYQHIADCVPGVSRSEDGERVVVNYVAAFRQTGAGDTYNLGQSLIFVTD